METGADNWVNRDLPLFCEGKMPVTTDIFLNVSVHGGVCYMKRCHPICFSLLITSFIQVVPTIYTDIRGRKIHSNQVKIMV
jgi:hypothetical protein